jgi:hypothetical protein
MKTITVTGQQLTKVGGIDNPLPQVGDGASNRSTGERGVIQAVRLVGKPFRKMHNGMFAGVVQKFEMVVSTH